MSLNFINPMAVKEITLSTGGMSAETATGGVSLKVVPKAATQRSWHGSHAASLSGQTLGRA